MSRTEPRGSIIKLLAIADRKLVILFLTWLLIAVSSVSFERLHDDEVQYFEEARQILNFGPVIHGYAVFVPQILGAIASLIYNTILSARTVSALMVLGTAIAIYKIGKENPGFIGSMLYLTSFYTIRFGLRFYLDPFGGFFTTLTIYAIYRGWSKSTGALSILGAFSRQLILPLVPVYAWLLYRKKKSVNGFLLGAVLISLLVVLWIFFASTLQSVIVGSSSEAAVISYLAISSIASIPKSWIEFLAISPLVLIGFIFAEHKRERIEFYPLVLSFVILSVTPGFIINGGATQYPYIFNTLACLPAGAGLTRLYAKVRQYDRNVTSVLVGILIVQLGVQSYSATALSPNHVVGIQDYGYNYDEELISYLNAHYSGGLIYGSNRDGMLVPALSANWVWIPQSVARALVANPPWLVTYTSYVVIKYVPVNVTVKTVGPYIVIHDSTVPLSSFIEASNSTGWFNI